MRVGRDGPAHRALCGILLALSSSGLAITAHGLAGGGLPDSALIIPVTALLAWAGAAFAGRPRGPLALILAVGVIQVGLHLLLSQSAYPHGGHHGSVAVSGAAMLGGHALATVLVAGLLGVATRGLALFSSAVLWLRGRLEVLSPGPVPGPDATTAGVASAVAARPGQLLETVLRRVLARRGPPICS